MKRWKNEFQSLHTFDPGGGEGPLSASRIEPTRYTWFIKQHLSPILVLFYKQGFFLKYWLYIYF